ncbi:MAG: hypothetical protein RL523_916 [Actinomycetota bacterium]|jgi:hypothetical protein
MSTNLVIGLAMVVSGVILAGYVIWMAVKYRNRERASRRDS